MPVILQQHFFAPGESSGLERKYEDIEEVIYHYPRQYFNSVKAFEPFIYYRPLGKSTPRFDSRRYFGHGILGEPWPDPLSDALRYVPIVQYAAFPQLVELKDPSGRYYETGTMTTPQGQSAVRQISMNTYHRILAAGNVIMTDVSALPAAAFSEALPYVALPPTWPKDALRKISKVPSGTGYVPRANEPPNVLEAAALQERARADHQRVLSEIVTKVTQLGGTCWYNNNIDLLASVDGQRLLIEAKSLNDASDAVHRMRYGMGQLLDYGVRYRAELEGAEPILAFGRAPDRETSWISEILNENKVGFVASIGGSAIPLNDVARRKVLFR